MQSFIIIYRNSKGIKQSQQVSAHDKQAAYDYYYQQRLTQDWDLIEIVTN